MDLSRSSFEEAAPKNPLNENDSVLDLGRVVPRIKAVFGGDIPDPSPRRTAEPAPLSLSEEDSPVMEPLTTGLAVFHALDQGDVYELLQNRHLSGEITRERLHEAALANLAQSVDGNVELHGEPSDVMMLTNGGNFEAAMLLLDGLWENVRDIFQDDLCVAVPARDLLFVAGQNNARGRESLRAVVRNFFDEQQTEGLLVRHIYTRENKAWVVVETA